MGERERSEGGESAKEQQHTQYGQYISGHVTPQAGGGWQTVGGGRLWAGVGQASATSIDRTPLARPRPSQCHAGRRFFAQAAR